MACSGACSRYGHHTSKPRSGWWVSNAWCANCQWLFPKGMVLYVQPSGRAVCPCCHTCVRQRSRSKPNLKKLAVSPISNVISMAVRRSLDG